MSEWADNAGAACDSGARADRRSIKRQAGSHKTLAREGWPDVVFAFRDSEGIGPRMLARIAKNTGLKPEDL